MLETKKFKEQVNKRLSKILDSGFFFDYLIKIKPDLICLVSKHRFFNFVINNDFYTDIKFRLFSNFSIDKKIVTKGYYDIKTQYILKRFLSSGDCFLDVGANVGSITFAALKNVGNTGMVYAFEPGPILFNMLSETIINSKVMNLKLFNIGCSDNAGLLYWRLDEENPGNAFLSAEETPVPVEIKRLDDVIPETQKVCMIKIDVEGMELEVLKGAQNIIHINQPFILIETNTNTKEEQERTRIFLEHLANLKYSFFAVRNRENELIMGGVKKVSMLPVSYPELPQNILAVHESKLDIISESLDTVR